MFGEKVTSGLDIRILIASPIRLSRVFEDHSAPVGTSSLRDTSDTMHFSGSMHGIPIAFFQKRANGKLAVTVFVMLSKPLTSH